MNMLTVLRSALLGATMFALMRVNVAATASEHVSPRTEIQRVLQEYVEATKTGNGQRARELFHADARMSGQIDNGKTYVGTPEPFFKALDGHPADATGPHPYSAVVQVLSVNGPIATGRIAERNLYGYNFEDHFHLLQIDGQWKIISKLYRGETAAPDGKATPKPH